MTIETGDTVVLEYTGRIVGDGAEDDAVFETSRESVAEESGLAELDPDLELEPLTVEVGEGELHEGLREALLGRAEGDVFTVTLPPEQAYGEYSEDDVREYDVDELEEMIGGYTPKEGGILETTDGQRVEVVSVEDGTARVDLNHPLTGETLEFDVEVVEVHKPDR